MKFRWIIAVPLFLLFFGGWQTASADNKTVLRVVVVQSDNVGEYVKQLGQAQAIFQRLGSKAQIRVWQAKFAGPNAGSVIASVQFPSLVDFANDDAKFAADPEAQAWLKGLDKLRKIVSDSLYTELTP